MTNIKNPSISITLFSPERLLCWPRRSVSTKRASLWNTSWPLSTSSPVLHCTPTTEQVKQVTTLNIITSSALHTNNWTSEASAPSTSSPVLHHTPTTEQQVKQLTTPVLHHTPTTEQQVKQLTTPVLHHAPTTEQVEHLATLKIITSSAPDTNN